MESMNHKPWLVMLFSLILAAAGCDNPQGPDTQGRVKIGFLSTSDRATYPKAAAIAVDEINERGGLLEMPVELVVRAEIEEVAVSVQAAEAMIRTDEVIAIIGPNRSSHAVEVGKLAQRHGLPMITTAATNPDVTKAGDFLFMASFTDLFQGSVMAQFVTEDLGLSRVATLTRRGDVYTEGISRFFGSDFSRRGGEVVAKEYYDRDAADFTDQLTRIAEMEPEAIFISGFAREVALVTRQARAIPVQSLEEAPVLFLGADSWDNPVLLGDEEAEIEGSFVSSHFSPNTDDLSARAFIDKYQALYGAVPSGGDAVSYDAVRLLFEAVERAGSLDPEGVRKQLEATRNYVGATRISRYDENHHPTKSAVIMTVENGAKRFHKQIAP